MLSAPSRFELANIIHKARLASGSARFLKFSAPEKSELGRSRLSGRDIFRETDAMVRANGKPIRFAPAFLTTVRKDQHALAVSADVNYSKVRPFETKIIRQQLFVFRGAAQHLVKLVKGSSSERVVTGLLVWQAPV